jgi:hypothetical protein
VATTQASARCGADPQLVRLAKDCLAINLAGRPAAGDRIEDLGDVAHGHIIG